MNSSSGGAFSTIVDIDSFLDKDGVVFGVAFSDKYSFVSNQEFSKENYVSLRKLKYVFQIQ